MPRRCRTCRRAIDERQTAAMNSLKARLLEARRDDSATRLRAARDDIDKGARKLKEAFAALAPWRGNAEALTLVVVPDEAEIAELRRRAAQCEGASAARVRPSGGQDWRSRAAQGRSSGGGGRGRPLERRDGGRDPIRARGGMVGASRGPRSGECRRIRSGDAARRRCRRRESGWRARTRGFARARGPARRRRGGTETRQGRPRSGDRGDRRARS